MAVAIFGDITDDNQSFVLLANGPDHEVAYAAKVLQTLTPKFKTIPGGLRAPATWPLAVQLAETYGQAWQPQPKLKAWLAQQVQVRTCVATELTYRCPVGLEPRPYQIDGAAMIAATGRCLLFDEPGTGKTITTILGLRERAFEHAVWPVLVICPATVVDNWVTEFRKWSPEFITVAWRGAKSTRANLVGSAHVYVVSYDTARNDASSVDPRDGNPLITLDAATVIADEVHLTKSHQSQRSRAVRRLADKAEHFVGLSGTPITHHPGDLWPSLVALEPGAWPSRERWVQRYCQSIPAQDYGETILGLHPAYEEEYRTTLLGRHRRVAKADVLSQLPPKIYSVRSVELPSAYRRAYDDMEAQMLAEMPDSGEELSVMSVLAQLTRLSQMACAAADVEVTVEVDKLGEEVIHQKVTLRNPSWKVDAMLEVLAERPDKQTVVFAPSRQLIMLAGEAARSEGYRVGYIIGGQSAKERTKNVDEFQAGKLDVICVTTQAGGVGITLTAGSTAVFLQRPWSLVDSIQAEDRLHRIGSEIHHSIEIVDIVAQKSIDTRVRSVLRGKAGQLADLVQDKRIVTELLGGSSATKTKKAA